MIKSATPLENNVLAPLRIRAAPSVIDASIQIKIHGSGATTLIISNKEMNSITKIAQALEDSNILLKEVTRTLKIKTSEPKGVYVRMLLDTLPSTLLGNVLKGRGLLRTGYGNKKECDFWCRIIL